ncbi:MAG: hypothetical protein MUO80_07590 [Dehalococcoidia bacterium]|nr:hypothetical protein [Dehalococcoidia bacterium]
MQPVNETARDALLPEMDSRLATGVLGFPPGLAAPDGPLATAAETVIRTIYHSKQIGLPAPAKSNAILKSSGPW